MASTHKAKKERESVAPLHGAEKEGRKKRKVSYISLK